MSPMPPSSSAAKAKHNTEPPPRPSPSPSPPRTSKTCWKGDPFLLAEACRRAGLELSTDLSLLPGDMLSMQHHARKQQVSHLLLDFGPAQKLLEEMVELDPRPMFTKTTVYLALKSWSANKKLKKAGRTRFLRQETARLFLFAKGARALKRDASGNEGDDGEDDDTADGDRDQSELDLLEEELLEESDEISDEAVISYHTCFFLLCARIVFVYKSMNLLLCVCETILNCDEYIVLHCLLLQS